MNCKKGLLIRLAASLTCCMMAGCSASRYIPEGEYLLDKASVSTAAQQQVVLDISCANAHILPVWQG